MKIILFIWFSCLTIFAQSYPISKDIECYQGDYTTLSFEISGNVTSDSLVFGVKADRLNATPRVIERRNTAGGGDDTEIQVIYGSKSTILVKLLTADTDGLTPAMYVYDLTKDTITIFTGYFKIRDDVLGTADGVATKTPYYTVALDTPKADPSFISGLNSTNAWRIRNKAEFWIDLGISDSITINGTDSAAVAGLINDSSDALRTEWKGDINDSLDSYLQVGDWSKIVDEYPLATARLLYQPVGELNLSTAAISSILDLGFTSDAASLIISDSLASASHIIPKASTTYNLGSASKYWNINYVRYLEMQTNSEISTGISNSNFMLDLGNVSFRDGNGGFGGSVTFLGYTKFYNYGNPSPCASGVNLYAISDNLYAMDKDSNITRVTRFIIPEQHPYNDMAIDDTFNVNYYDYATTWDSVKYDVDPGDTIRIQIEFGDDGPGTNVFSSPQELVGRGTLTSFNDNTIPANSEVQIYFTYISASATKFWLHIYKKD